MDEKEMSMQYISGYIKRAQNAQMEFEKMSQQQVDLAVKTIGKVVYDNAEYLAEIAVEETGMGNVPDKIAKNRQKSKIVWNNLRGERCQGDSGHGCGDGNYADRQAYGGCGRHYPLYQSYRYAYEQRYVRAEMRQRHYYYTPS